MTSKGRQLAEAYPPGDMLQEKLAELGMSVKEFALRCGKPEPTIHGVLKGRSAVTPDMALLFEKVLGIPAGMWLKFQCLYDEYKARCRNDAELQKDSEWMTRFPVSEMVSKGYLKLSKGSSCVERLGALLDFFGFGKASVWEKYYQSQALKAEFRISLRGVENAYALSAWLRRGEIQASLIGEVPGYSREKLKEVVPEMQKLANCGGAGFLPHLTELCRKAGVILVFTPHLRKTKVLGATRWVRNTPLVQVTKDFKRFEELWFTFFHEIGHVLLHGKRECFLEGIEYAQEQKEKEAEANAFAENCLVPKRIATQLKLMHDPESSLLAFCQKEHIHVAFAERRLKQWKRLKKV